VEPRAQCLEYGHRGEGLGRDELERVLLALQLLFEEVCDLGVGGAHGGFVGEPGACGDARTDVDVCAGHCDLCPSVVDAGKPPRSESNAAALIGPSRSTRGVVVVQSMIVEASPAERPPSTTVSISAPSAAATPAAVSAAGSPWRLALVVASGPVRRSSSSAIGWFGIRTMSVVPSRGTAQR